MVKNCLFLEQENKEYTYVLPYINTMLKQKQIPIRALHGGGSQSSGVKQIASCLTFDVVD